MTCIAVWSLLLITCTYRNKRERERERRDLPVWCMCRPRRKMAKGLRWSDRRDNSGQPGNEKLTFHNSIDTTKRRSRRQKKKIIVGGFAFLCYQAKKKKKLSLISLRLSICVSSGVSPCCWKTPCPPLKSLTGVWSRPVTAMVPTSSSCLVLAVLSTGTERPLGTSNVVCFVFSLHSTSYTLLPPDIVCSVYNSPH